MKKIATAAMAVFSCLIFLLPSATSPAEASTIMPYDLCRYVYTTGEPTFNEDDFRQANGLTPLYIPIAQYEFYRDLCTGVIDPNGSLYYILEFKGLYQDDGTLARRFIEWREAGVRIMLITHYDERFFGENMEPDDIRIDYMNYANVFLCLDVFYDFATDVLVNTILETQQYDDEEWINKTTHKTAFKGTLILDKFFTEYMSAENIAKYCYMFSEYWRSKHSSEYSHEMQLWYNSLCEADTGDRYVRKNWFEYSGTTDTDLWDMRREKPILDTPYFFVRSVKPLNRSMQAEVETAEDLGIPYWDYTFTTDPGESGYLPSEEDFRQMKNDYLYAFFSGEDIPHEPK